MKQIKNYESKLKESKMSELIMACAKLKVAMSNDCAVQRYIIMKSPNYTHPGWIELQHQLKYPRKKVYGNNIYATKIREVL